MSQGQRLSRRQSRGCRGVGREDHGAPEHKQLPSASAGSQQLGLGVPGRASPHPGAATWQCACKWAGGGGWGHSRPRGRPAASSAAEPPTPLPPPSGTSHGTCTTCKWQLLTHKAGGWGGVASRRPGPAAAPLGAGRKPHTRGRRAAPRAQSKEVPAPPGPAPPPIRPMAKGPRGCRRTTQEEGKAPGPRGPRGSALPGPSAALLRSLAPYLETLAQLRPQRAAEPTRLICTQPRRLTLLPAPGFILKSRFSYVVSY